MKRVLFTIAVTMLVITASPAQERNHNRERKPFSHEEFQAKQRQFIAEKADLTKEEADAFFPLFFELQKKKFEIEREVRKASRKPQGEKMNEDECREHVYRMADTKIEIAKLEREYTDKYMKVLNACKLQKVLHAEGAFQRHLMKEMIELKENRKPER